jgi:hypothetical protein
MSVENHVTLPRWHQVWNVGLMQENSEARKRESPYLPDPHARIHITLPACRHVPSRSALDFFLLKTVRHSPLG